MDHEEIGLEPFLVYVRAIFSQAAQLKIPNGSLAVHNAHVPPGGHAEPLVFKDITIAFTAHYSIVKNGAVGMAVAYTARVFNALKVWLSMSIV